MANHSQIGADAKYVCTACKDDNRCTDCIDVLRAAYTDRRICTHGAATHADAVQRAGERHAAARRAGPGEPCITCPACGRTSYHQQDIATGYCGWCHDFTTKVVTV